MKLTYKLKVLAFMQREGFTNLVDSFDYNECYEMAWKWYAITGKTSFITSNMFVCHVYDANKN